MLVSVNILNVPNVTVSVPQEQGLTSADTMRKAGRRYASQGARGVSLVPNRKGDGWAVAARANQKEK